MKLKKILSAVVALSITASMAVIPMSAKAENEMNVYYSQDFESVTDFKAWESENASPSHATPFQTWGDRDVSEVEEADGNTYLWSKSLAIRPLAQTAKTGKYVFEFDFQPVSYTATATNWEAGVMEMSLGSTYNTNQDWHAILLSSSAGASLTDGEYPVDTLKLFGNAMTLCGSGWINVKVLYDCGEGKITATVTDEAGNTVTASENMKAIGAGFEGDPTFMMEQLASQGGGRIDNVKVYDYVEPKQPDTGLEDGVYYLENFDSTTKEEWDAKYNSDKRIDYQVTYAWGNAFTTLEDGNNVLHKTNGDAYWFDVTPQTGIYELKFDIRPAIKTAAANTTVTNFDIAGDWMQSSNISFITDANGDVNKMKFKVGSTDKTITIDPEKWVTVKVVRNFETNVNIVTASYEGQTLEGQEETTRIKSSFSYDKNTTPTPGIYLDNISVMDYVEPEPEDGTYYNDDFDSITATEWAEEQKNAAEVPGKTTYAYNVNHFTEDNGNNALKIDGTADLYLFSSTPKTGKYTAKFDLKPLQTTGPASSTVFRADLAARWIEGVNLSFITDADGNVNKLKVYDKELVIDPTKWVTIEYTRDFSVAPNPVTVTVTQGKKIVTGTENATASYVKSSCDINKLATADFAGVLIDNVSVKDYVEPEPEEDGAYYNDDFDSITAAEWAEEQKNDVEVLGKTTYAYNVNHFTEDNGNNALKIDGTADLYLFSSTAKTGKYTAKFDLKPLQTTGPASSTVFRADLVARWMEGVNLSLITDADGNVKKLQVYDKELAIDPTKWTTIELTRDFSVSPNPVTVTVTHDGKSVTGTENATASFAKTSCDLNKVATADFAGVLIDNVSVKDFSESEAPKLSAEDIKLYADGVEQKATKVSSFTDKIVINFGQSMKKADMSEACIWVEDEAGAKVSNAEYAYEDGVLTITYPDGFASGKKFTIKLQGVRNNGGVMMEDVEKSFITTTGVFAELVSITQDGNKVGSVADLTAGLAKINVSYSNTESTEPVLHVIAAYYNDGALVKAEFFKWATSKGLPLINYGFNYTVPTIEGGYDKVQFMVWDGFNTLKPLSTPITLK